MKTLGEKVMWRWAASRRSAAARIIASSGTASAASSSSSAVDCSLCKTSSQRSLCLGGAAVASRSGWSRRWQVAAGACCCQPPTSLLCAWAVVVGGRHPLPPPTPLLRASRIAAWLGRFPLEGPPPHETLRPLAQPKAALASISLVALPTLPVHQIDQYMEPAGDEGICEWRNRLTPWPPRSARVAPHPARRHLKLSGQSSLHVRPIYPGMHSNCAS